jgi:hypothetical protein
LTVGAAHLPVGPKGAHEHHRRSALASRVKVTALAVADSCRRATGGRNRSCSDLADELASVADRCPDAVAEANALLDLAEVEQLTTEMYDLAAVTAAAMFLGRRLIETNARRITDLWPDFEERPDSRGLTANR